jgi:hypothetical protein
VLSRTRLLASLRFGRRLLVGLLLCYVVTALTLGGTPRARPLFHGLAAIWAVVLTAGACLALRRPHPPGRTLRLVELVLTNTALALCLGELSLQGFAAGYGRSVLLGATLDDHRLAPGRDYGAGLRGNRRGYPGPDVAPVKPPRVVRIAALGDSFAVGPAVPFTDNYLTLLQGALPGVEVCNLGVTGAGPREYHAILQQDGWAIQPDLVLVSVFVGNDITEAMPTPRHLDPRRHALFLFAARGWRFLREGRPTNAARGGEPPPRLGAPALSEKAFREVEARRLAVCVAPPSADMEKRWRRALGHLEALVRGCGARRVPIAFVLIPDEFQVNREVRAAAVRDAGVELEALDLELPQRRLREFCAGRGVACLDLLDDFRGTTDTYAPRDTHWNARGNRLAAARLAAWLPQLLTR